MSDRPWVPAGLTPLPLYGTHYFGDFQLGILYSSVANPYLGERRLPYGYPPAIHILLNVLSSLPLAVCLLIYLALSISLTFLAIFRLLNVKTSAHRTIVISMALAIMGFSLPFIVALDRGNYVAICVPLCSLALSRTFFDQSKNGKRNWGTAFLLFLAICLKAYILVLLIPLYLLHHKTVVQKTLFLLISINLFLSFFYKGGPTVVVKTYVKGLLFYKGNTDPYFAIQGNGLLAGIGRFMESVLRMDWHPFILRFGPWGLLIGTIWFGLTVFVSTGSKLSNDLKISILLSNIQFFAPTSMFYTDIWSMFALAAVTGGLLGQGGRQTSSIESNRIRSRLRIIVGIASICSLIPNPTQYFVISSPFCWILVLGLMVLFRTGVLWKEKSRAK